eukprot:7390018-Prorocentrum_lima.AAC.1
MTSSLVGSEMCIRDRSKHTIWAVGFADSGQGSYRPGAELCKLTWPHSPCLLYTSDAADDM